MQRYGEWAQLVYLMPKLSTTSKNMMLQVLWRQRLGVMGTGGISMRLEESLEFVVGNFSGLWQAIHAPANFTIHMAIMD